MRSVRFPLSCLLILLAAMLCPRPAAAATFQAGGDADLRCIMTISGPIVAGDAQDFRAALHDIIGDPYKDNPVLDAFRAGNRDSAIRICLDSRGGVLSEALKMADVLTSGERQYYGFYRDIGTVVPAGAECLSACAVLFMAGGNETETRAGRVPNRILHVQGQLGFHAPGLQIEGGNYSAEAVDRAFKIAIASVDALSSRQQEIRFPASLFARMVTTPADDMYMVDTVGKATQWMIDLAGVPPFEQFGTGHFVNACLNARPQIDNGLSYLETYVPGFDVAEAAWWNAERHSESRYEGDYRRGALDMDRDRRDSGPDFLEITYESNPVPGDETGLHCTATMRGYWPLEREFETDYRRIVIDFDTTGYMWVSKGALLPPWLPLAEAARMFAGKDSIGPDDVLWSTSRRHDQRCMVFDRGERNTDDDPCTRRHGFTFFGDGRMVELSRFEWPSGAVTVLETRDGDTRINGREAEGEYIDHPALDGPDDFCVLNTGSGNTFCSVPDRG